jgi:hypothetical protein
MHGEVTSYNAATGALVVDIKSHTGSGTYTSWVLNLDGTPVDAITGSGTINEIAYFTAARIIASLPVATYPSLTELSYVRGVNSAIQTQINAKQDAITLTTTGTSGAATLVGATLNIPQYSGGGASNYKSTTDGIATSTANNTLSQSQLITGGTFATGDIIRIHCRMRATGIAGTKTMRIYVNATNDLTAAVLVATYLSGVNSTIQGMKRDLVIKSATNTETFPATVAIATDDSAANSFTISNIDWSINQYIIFANQRNSALDTLLTSSYLIEKL